jgi:hypothetical protein
VIVEGQRYRDATAELFVAEGASVTVGGGREPEVVGTGHTAWPGRVPPYLADERGPANTRDSGQ